MDWHVLSAGRTSSWVPLLAFRVWQFCILLSFVVCSWGPPWLQVCLEVAGGRGGSTLWLRGVRVSRLKFSLAVEFALLLEKCRGKIPANQPHMSVISRWPKLLSLQLQLNLNLLLPCFTPLSYLPYASHQAFEMIESPPPFRIRISLLLLASSEDLHCSPA
jgi:hypothetical protein